MAVRALCDSCNKSFSAQDEYLGKKVKCPSCGTKVAVLSPDELEAKNTWRREQDERLELLEAMEERDRQKTMGTSYAVEFGTGLEPVRNFNPGAVSRFRKLRALSSFLLLGAYLGSVLLVGAGGLVVYLHYVGVIESVIVLTLSLLGMGIGLVIMFCCFKFLGELSWLLADLGDHQLDVRNLLIDLRDDLDRMKAGKPRPRQRARS